MNTSQFMDKQIMDLSNSQSKSDFISLMNPQEDDITAGKKEEIVPSYDFQPIRPVGASQPSNIDSSSFGETRVWSSADSKANATGIGIRHYGSLDSSEPAKVILEKDRSIFDSALFSEVDQTMKKYADNLLHAMEGISARLSQLESRSRQLENSVDDLKVSVGNNHGTTEGKLRQMENILREVQAGVHVIKDKQEILEAQVQLAKLQVPKVEQQSDAQNAVHVDSVQHVSAPQQSHQHLPPMTAVQPPAALAPPNATPPPPSQQNLPPPVHVQNQYSQNPVPSVPSSVPHRESYFPSPGQTQETTTQQFQLPPPQQQIPPAPTPMQQYQLPPHSQYSQTPLPPQQHPSLTSVNPPQPQGPLPQPQGPLPQPQPPHQHQPSLGHLPDEPPYMPSQNYPPSLRQPSGTPPSQQFYGTPSHMYEPPSSRPGLGFSTAYGSPSVPTEPYPYGGSPSQYGIGSTGKSQQLPSAAAQSGGTGYPQLPTARILPHALPTASGVGGGSGSSGSGNRLPIDDVVDKVTNMGFSREQVRAMVRKLTENGQSVDLNVVLDKLMSDGESQPQRGWFGR